MARKRTEPVGACALCGSPLYDVRARYCSDAHRARGWREERAARDAEISALLLAARKALASQ